MSNRRLEGDHLDDLVFERITDSQGNVEVRVGGTTVAGGLSRQGEAGRQMAEAAADAPTEADVEAYENLRYYDPDFAVVQAEMARLAAEVDPAAAARIDSNFRAFVEEYGEVKNRMVGQEIDAPRHGELSRLRAQLREEDLLSGCRQTARREEIVSRIARLHGGGR